MKTKRTRYLTRGYLLRMAQGECVVCDGNGKFRSNGYHFDEYGNMTIIHDEVDTWLICDACSGTGRMTNAGRNIYWNDIKTIPEKYLEDDFDLEADRPI